MPKDDDSSEIVIDEGEPCNTPVEPGTLEQPGSTPQLAGAENG